MRAPLALRLAITAASLLPAAGFVYLAYRFATSTAPGSQAISDVPSQVVIVGAGAAIGAVVVWLAWHFSGVPREPRVKMCEQCRVRLATRSGYCSVECQDEAIDRGVY